jgi:plastocyanin
MAVRASRFPWIVVVMVFATFAVATPVIVIRYQLQAKPAKVGAGKVVSMIRLAYSPRELRTRRGTRLVFNNTDSAPHTVTADNRSFDSGILAPTKSYGLVVEKSISYHCTIHHNMTGKIVVTG